ncbi:hypothetical protein LWI29_012026 [Acer saccharum]|uniref:YqgF/RNase H-like domain-containing protein n=1 Tax=Acer saccharum TaxID=4024 RepID=A0AA39V961_ACESA|nr:hypothetical protein LWI29_012026 [Acer saccharum]
MKFLKPVTFYKEVFKDILMKNASKHGRLLGLDVSDKCVSLAVSDSKNLTAVPLRGLHMKKTNMTSMVDMFQSLISEHNLVCFVVGTPYTRDCDAKPFLEETQIFIDNLCKTGKLEGFKYTYWDSCIRSKNSEFVLEQHVQFILEHLNQPQDMSKTIMDKCHAVSALQGFLDCTHKMHRSKSLLEFFNISQMKYMKPLRLFEESVRSYSTVLFGLSACDKHVSLSITDEVKMSAFLFGYWPRDENFLDKLVNRIEGYMSKESGDPGREFDVDGIIVGKNPVRAEHQSNVLMDIFKECITPPTVDMYSAVYMLQGNVDFFNTLLHQREPFVYTRPPQPPL